MMQPRAKTQKRSHFILLLVILLWSMTMGWGLALATNAQPSPKQAATEEIGTVDIVPSRYQLGQELYLENCATCHIALPPAVMPTQTWQRLLQDPQHYGVTLPQLVDPPRLLIWNYLRNFSRPLLKEETIPYRLGESRYLKALHPNVKLPRPVNVGSCVSCHPSATEYNFRRLSPEWEATQ
ncbi:diheme cytochrome C [Gloeocapsa sp. PCC 7428]|uniref:diheme cytochrome C n=1 Tax=Gloeocapsa sp. PCC 7428 TaxID=1173026 RepID=UPI0005A4F5EB|nr:diheme cytochrome C [Gloeocapsa sp. PCC 7428]